MKLFLNVLSVKVKFTLATHKQHNYSPTPHTHARTHARTHTYTHAHIHTHARVLRRILASRPTATHTLTWPFIIWELI